MRHLKVYAGPNPNDVELLQPLTARKSTVSVASSNYKGEISLYLRGDENGATHGVAQESSKYHGPTKNFSFQVSGEFNYIPRHHPLFDPNQPKMWSFDDILFAVELDRPVPWSSVPVPQWIINGVYRWLKRMNADVVIDGVFVDDSSKSDGQHGDLDSEAFQQQPNKKPEINVPLVCASNSMNMWNSGNQWSDIMKEYLGMGFMDSDQQRRQYEFSLIQYPERPIWSYQHLNHQFPKELVEFNAYLFPDQTPKDRHPSFRRAHFRETIATGSSDHTRTTVHLEQSRNCRWTNRNLHYFHPGLTYGFDFYADYFDFQTFTLRPKAQPSPAGFSPPKGILNFLAGRWQIDISNYLRSNSLMSSDSGKTCSRIVLSCKSRPFHVAADGVTARQSQVYFWSIIFELMDD